MTPAMRFLMINAAFASGAGGPPGTDLGTNFFTAPEDFTDVVWLKNGTTPVASAEPPPPGVGITACQRIEENAGGSFHLCNQDNTELGVTATRFIFSAYFKADERTGVYMAYSDQVLSGSYCYFDLSSGVKGTNGTVNEGIIDIGDGWYRCWIEGQTANSGVGRVDCDIGLVVPTEDVSYSGTAGYGLFATGAMLELATGGPTAYSST